MVLFRNLELSMLIYISDKSSRFPRYLGNHWIKFEKQKLYLWLQAGLLSRPINSCAISLYNYVRDGMYHKGSSVVVLSGG